MYIPRQSLGGAHSADARRPRLVVVERQPANRFCGQEESLGDDVEFVVRRRDEVRPNELPRRHRLHVEIGDRLVSIGAVRVQHADARAAANRCGPDAMLEFL